MQKTTKKYKCGNCDYVGPAYGIPTGSGVTAPYCPKCQKNDKLTLIETKDKLYDEIVEQNRVGRFKVSNILIKMALSVIMENIFSKVFIVKAEFLYNVNGFEYTAYSSYFDEISEAEEAPEYIFDIEVADNDGSVKTIKARRV